MYNFGQYTVFTTLSMHFDGCRGVDVSQFASSMYNFASTITSSGRNMPFILPLKTDKLDTGFQVENPYPSSILSDFCHYLSPLVFGGEHISGWAAMQCPHYLVLFTRVIQAASKDIIIVIQLPLLICVHHHVQWAEHAFHPAAED
jgi:hypothetical protein